ncbi:hypothetical protein PspLS_08115 [Pyricularia sp. CBS 133598]|nr:hypothetical protein PspLS_08115 [Pyricularia sp. CBS 133598]
MTSQGEPVLFSLYVYAPTEGAPIFFSIAFGLSAVFHIYQCYRYRAFKLIGLHPICAVLFTAGYALRQENARDRNYIYNGTDSGPLVAFIVSQVLILTCPPLLELANYHILGRIFYFVPHHAPLKPSRVLVIFGGLMVATLNALGVALAANPSLRSDQQALGKILIITAVSLQVFLIIVFVALSAIFHRRCIRAEVPSRAINILLPVLYTSMALIFARCIYRLVEYTGNTKIDLDNPESLRSLSPILRYEVYFYVFEASLMLINSWVWNLWHPGRFLPRSHNIYLGRDGREVEGQKVVDERSVVKKMIHILTFGVLFGRKKQSDDLELRETGTSRRPDESREELREEPLREPAT